MLYTQLEEIEQLTKKLLEGCRKTAIDGTVIFTPDCVSSYDALWVRDLGYMVEYCGDLMKPEEIEGCIRFALAGQREDGWLPDRMEASGEAVYAAGAKDAPVGLANLDNTPFAVFAVYFYLIHLNQEKGKQKFAEWIDQLNKGMSCIPLSENGLVYNHPERVHSPYGFTDTVCKTGELFMESLLFWRACIFLEELIIRYDEDKETAIHYRTMADAIQREIYRLYDEESGMFFAASGFCRQLDIWGNAYLLYIGFPINEKTNSRIKSYLTEHVVDYCYHGQICHTPKAEPWEKLLIGISPGEYQNGAYWATASGWVLWLLFQTDLDFAEKLLAELLEDFSHGSACECINVGYRKLPQFVVSGVNVRGALKRIIEENKNH